MYKKKQSSLSSSSKCTSKSCRTTHAILLGIIFVKTAPLGSMFRQSSRLLLLIHPINLHGKIKSLLLIKCIVVVVRIAAGRIVIANENVRRNLLSTSIHLFLLLIISRLLLILGVLIKLFFCLVRTLFKVRYRLLSTPFKRVMRFDMGCHVRVRLNFRVRLSWIGLICCLIFQVNHV